MNILRKLMIFTLFLELPVLYASELDLEKKWNHESDEPRELIRIGLEDTPGLLQPDRKGVIDLVLAHIEKRTKYKFKVTYLSYVRAKIEMKKGNLDMIGLTPHGQETGDFYEYAQELDWSFNTNLVLFCNTKENLKLENGEMIGTPIGNEGFISKQLGVNVSRLKTGSLQSIILRVSKKREPCLAFEEVSTLTLGKELGISQLHYRIIGEVRGSFAFRKNKRGRRIKESLDKELSSINWSKYLQNIKRLPKKKGFGIVVP